MVEGLEAERIQFFFSLYFFFFSVAYVDTWSGDSVCGELNARIVPSLCLKRLLLFLFFSLSVQCIHSSTSTHPVNVLGSVLSPCVCSRYEFLILIDRCAIWCGRKVERNF